MKLLIHRIVLVSYLLILNYFEVFFKTFLGDFQIEVFQDDILIDDKPNTARAFDVNKVMIHDFPSSSIVDSSTYFISK
jgi:hypothetical protein